MTIAVDDMASAAPMIAAEAGAQAESPGDRAERQRRDDDLREAEPENEPAHEAQALERQFEPHREQERDDAERGELIDRFDLDRECAEPGRSLAQRTEPVGSERDAGEQVAEHRADAQAEEQRRDDPRRRQEEQRLLVNRKVGRLVQGEGSLRGKESLVDFNQSASLAVLMHCVLCVAHTPSSR